MTKIEKQLGLLVLLAHIRALDDCAHKTIELVNSTKETHGFTYHILPKGSCWARAWKVLKYSRDRDTTKRPRKKSPFMLRTHGTWVP